MDGVACSNPDASSGVWVQPGAGSWTVISDRNGKTNFHPVSGREVLGRLMEIPIETWNYKSQDAAIRHIGPMAQDFSKAFDVGGDDRGISTIDADGVALAAIQGLFEMIQERDAMIGRLEVRITALEKAAGLSAPVQLADAADPAVRERRSLHPESWDPQARFQLAGIRQNPFTQASQEVEQETEPVEPPRDVLPPESRMEQLPEHPMPGAPKGPMPRSPEGAQGSEWPPMPSRAELMELSPVRLDTRKHRAMDTETIEREQADTQARLSATEALVANLSRAVEGGAQ